jgi:anthraniloyl-CoA monooxygenase
MKARRPDWSVTLFERNRADDAFGFGVVFSDATLEKIAAADSVLTDALREHGTHWDAIDVVAKGEVRSFGGNGMAAIHRKTLLRLLQEKAAGAGVDLRFASQVGGLADLREYDVVVAADGANSRLRSEVGEAALGHAVDEATAKFIWFGTDHMFDGLTFLHRRSEHGNFAVHAYPISPDVSTFIVETDAETWAAAGLDEFDVTQPPGPSDERTRAYLTDLFAEELDGGQLLTNNSRWGNFRTRSSSTWHAGNVAFLGDAVHTAHFSVGSGTKMAMEDAIALADALDAHGDPSDADAGLAEAFAAYEAAAQPSVRRVQDAAGPSLAWWEHFGEYHEALEPWQFAFHFFSRSIPLRKIRRRDAAFAAAVEDAWREAHGAEPLLTPLAVGEQEVPGRLLRRTGAGLAHADGALLDERGVVVVDLDVPGEQPDTTAAAAVVVTGGGERERIRASEHRALAGSIPVLLDLPDADDDEAATMVLSGRADAVIVR